MLNAPYLKMEDVTIGLRKTVSPYLYLISCECISKVNSVIVITYMLNRMILLSCGQDASSQIDISLEPYRS